MVFSEYYKWLKVEWAKTGFIVSIFLLVFLIVFVKPVDFVVFLLLLQTPLYMLHQTEEYVFPGGFKKFANTKSVLALPEPENSEPVSDTLIAIINLGYWAIFIIAALLANIVPWLGFGMIIFNVVNNVIVLKIKRHF